MVFAHSRNAAGQRQELVEHLRAVADAAADFAAPFAGAEFVRWAGLLHDIGKAGRWQDYLAACEREPGRRHRSVDHKGAGAVAALGVREELAFLIAGHHGGLPDAATLRTWLKERQGDADAQQGQAWATVAGILPPDRPVPDAPDFPSFAVRNEQSFEFWLRMCFSALVDADHRDTERHFSPSQAAVRGAPDLGLLFARLTAAQATLTGQRNDPVNRVRDEVYRACLAMADRPPGFFRLTVPTGGGKTRSGLAFALRHALSHELRRVIVAVPFLTITDQTADVFRAVLGDDRAVLEHHSGTGIGDDLAGEPTPAATWRRLACQDWDAPVIVTTTVQLFESLFGRSPASCRKLHRIARSVIVLDEVQTLPPPLLAPILDVLSELVANYGTSVVLCTATQPAFARAPGFACLDGIPEIAPDPPRLFATLKRVEYEWPALTEAPWDWSRVAAELETAWQALAIVNTKADALALLDALGDPDTFHLSTLLCSAHRRDVLALVRRRLADGAPCRVVSTQVVEAGVDLDFPLVLRAMGPLDRIVQAAGRCNREGRPTPGRVVIFAPEHGGLPPGPYRAATQLTEGLLADGPPDLDNPAIFEQYFARLFPLLDLDAKGIQSLRQRLEYARVADEFQMIGDDTGSVIVPYEGLGARAAELPADRRRIDHARLVKEAVAALRPSDAPRDFAEVRRWLARAQPYVVSIRRPALEQAVQQGFVSELVGGLWAWERGYDDGRGLTTERNPDEFVV